MAAIAAVNQVSRFDLKRRTPIVKPPPRIVVMGEPGIGKTTFGTSAPKAVLIPTEDGALAVDIPRLPVEGKCETWTDMLSACRALLDGDHDFEWAVFDTLNGAHHLCAQLVCDRDFGGKWNTTKGVEGFNAFGKGEKATAEEFRQFLGLCDQLQQKRRMGIIMLSHVGLLKQGNALGPDFYKFAGDVDKSTWALVCGWADQVGHACREMRASARDGEKAAKATAVGSERWLVFEGGPGRDAKSRVGYEMPERILLSWEEYEATLWSDRVTMLVDQALAELAAAPDGARNTVAQRLGGEISAERLKAQGKNKLEALIGWLLSKKAANQEGK